MEPDIVITCPKCSGRAAFFSPSVIRQTVVVPSLEGKMSCPSCGLNRSHTFNSTDYFYKIEIGGRFLFARSLRNAATLKEYFSSGERTYSPEKDFPKVFYEHREEIVRKLGDLIAAHS